ncbi:MAG TPA: ABC transporter substrate-binding protein [Stellaceae bacterium]|nr:ABC transporter substrate-binding protein [Stellaceae bacterium]
MALFATRAVAAEKVKIGFLSWFPPAMNVDLGHFREGMEQFGRVEGRDYTVESYFAGGDPALARTAAEKLVREPVDILVVEATPAVHIAKKATGTIPIVMETANAVATGLVQSLAHPGGNITGVSLLMTDLAGKRLSLLREMRPSLSAVAFLGSTRDPNAQTFVRETQDAAKQLGIRLSVRLVDGPETIDQATFDAMNKEGDEAVIVQPIFTGYQDKIVPLATKAGLPTVSDWAVFADAGALFSYGASQGALVKRLGYYVDRILKGAKPGDLPIEQPEQFEFVINARTAARLGWTIPRVMKLRADRVIE